MGIPGPRAGDRWPQIISLVLHQDRRSAIYDYRTVNQIGNTAFLNATTYGGGTVVGNCTRTLEVDEHNIVVRWEWKGNNCPFAEAFDYSSWRRKLN
jgi:hypothetical protein